MGFGDITTSYKPSTTSKGFGAVSSFNKKKPKNQLNTTQGLEEIAKKYGLSEEAKKILNPPKKLSALQRIGEGLGAFNPAEALLTGQEKGVSAGIQKYFTGAGTDIAEALTGKDIDPTQRRTFADVAEKAGIENKILKGGIGFIGDVLLDPSTYFGGAIAKGLSAGAKGVVKLASKIEPIGDVIKGVEKGFGKAFQFGYGTSKGLSEKALEVSSKLAKAKEGIVESNLARLGTGTLSKGQQEELVDKLLAGKRTEFEARQAGVKLPVAKSQISPDLEQKMLEFEFKKDVVFSNPARQLSKYANKRTGELPEVLGFGKSKFGNQGDQFMSELGFKDSEQAREAYQTYKKSLEELKNLKDEIKSSKSLFKDEQALNDFLSVDEATYLKRKALAREAAQSSDPLVQKTIEEQAIRSQKFAKQAGIQDPYEIYFPGLKNDSVKNFIEGTKQLRVGSEGYIKQFKNLLTDEQLIKNPAEAFAKREFDIARDNIVRSELDQIVKEYGEPLTKFKNADEALKAGYKEIKDKGRYGKVIGYLKEEDKKFLDNLISPEFTSIDMLAKATGFDALTSLFKRSVTGLFPSFHVRNFVSGHIQNFETLGIGALNPKMIASGQKMAYKLATKDKSLFKGKMGKAMKAFEKRFGTSSRYIADIADATKEASFGGAKGVLGKTIGEDSFVFRNARAIGNFIETAQKSTAYLTALSQGKSIKEALELATRAGFDYRALTGFESKILRRLIPFYSFTRKNIELQLKTLGENPQRINQIISALENAQGDISNKEKQALPDYAQEGFVVKTGTTKDGLPEIASGFGTPIEAFTSLFGFGGKNFTQKQLSTLNNIIKFPLEKAVGKDFFLNRNLKDIVEANIYKDMPKFIKDFIDFKEVKTTDKNGKPKIKYTGDPEKMHLLRQLPTSRGVSYLSAIFADETTNRSKLLYALTGIKPKPIDLETVEYFRNRDRQRELEDLLVRSGIIKRFETNYVPKTNK